MSRISIIHNMFIIIICAIFTESFCLFMNKNRGLYPTFKPHNRYIIFIGKFFIRESFSYFSFKCINMNTECVHAENARSRDELIFCHVQIFSKFRNIFLVVESDNQRILFICCHHSSGNIFISIVLWHSRESLSDFCNIIIDISSVLHFHFSHYLLLRNHWISLFLSPKFFRYCQLRISERV